MQAENKLSPLENQNFELLIGQFTGAVLDIITKGSDSLGFTTLELAIEALSFEVCLYDLESLCELRDAANNALDLIDAGMFSYASLVELMLEVNNHIADQVREIEAMEIDVDAPLTITKEQDTVLNSLCKGAGQCLYIMVRSIDADVITLASKVLREARDEFLSISGVEMVLDINIKPAQNMKVV